MYSVWFAAFFGWCGVVEMALKCRDVAEKTEVGYTYASSYNSVITTREVAGVRYACWL